MMKKLAILALCGLPAVALADPGLVPNPTGFDPYASEAISRLDYQAAETRLMRRLDADGADVSAMLNLAAVMQATNRTPRASRLYEEVLAADNVQLALPDGSPVWSHEIAENALDSRATVAGR